jgi:mediator of RNA polymerase II transcription subunit 10
MVQVKDYDIAGRSTKDVLENSMYVPIPTHLFFCRVSYGAAFRKTLDRTLLNIHTTASHPTSKLPSIPPELIGYIDNGRNPDIYTREFVELARRGNQLMKGKMDAFSSFRDVLAEEMENSMPELREDIGKVVESTGGKKKTSG